MPRSPRTVRAYGRNLLALVVASGAMGIAHLNFDSLGTGSCPLATSASFAGPPTLTPPSPELPVRIDAPSPSGTSGAPDTTISRHDDPTTLRGIWGIKMASALLEKGCDSFRKIPDYTASFFRQERVGGALSEGQTIELKVRHEPFSVYMKWLSGDRGRQLIYVQGQNEGNLLVQPGGIKGRLTGVLSLEPNSSLAMSESRYPVTKAGILELAQIILSYQKQDIQRGAGFRCEFQDGQQFEGRPCYLYLIEYESPQINADYRKSMVFIDKELSMPVCVKNFTWVRDANPETIDQESLVEFYAYTDLRIERQLTAGDFDQNNSDYKLRVRR